MGADGDKAFEAHPCEQIVCSAGGALALANSGRASVAGPLWPGLCGRAFVGPEDGTKETLSSASGP